jgi:MraZ protein
MNNKDLKIAFPKNYNSEIYDKVILTKGKEKCIYIFSPDKWESIKDNFDKGFCIKINENDVLIIPAELKDYARLIKDVVCLKRENYLEMWPKEKFPDFFKKKSQRKCLCDNPNCAKCLLKNCQDPNCNIHTKKAKKKTRKRFK